MLSLLERQQREGPAWPAQCMGFPPSLADLNSPSVPKSPRPRWGDGREEEESWGEGRGGGPWLIGVRLSCLLGKTPPGLKMGV